MQNMDYRAVDKAVDLIRQADIILLYGIGDSGVTARAFMNRLIKLKKIAILATDGEESVYSLMADQKALGIFVSYRGGLIRMINCARILKKNNVPYISLSSDTSTWLTENATVALKIPSFEVQSDNIATFYSQEAFSFVLNVIYGVLYNRAYEENRSRKKAIDDMTSTDYM